MDRTPCATLENPILPQKEKIGPDIDNNSAEERQCNAAENDLCDNSQNKGKIDFCRRDGSWEVYKYYTRSAGPWNTALFIASFIVSAFLSTFSSEFSFR
jgi:hypothetical protein